MPTNEERLLQMYELSLNATERRIADEREAMLAKTARLRELRLAKEAAESEAKAKTRGRA